MNAKQIKIIHDIGVCNNTISNYTNLFGKYDTEFLVLKIREQSEKIKKLYNKLMESINNE